MLLKLAMFLSLLGTAGTAVAAKSGAKSPTDKWIVDFADAQCVASRAYGSMERPLYLVLKAPPLGDVMQIAMVRKGSGGPAEQLEATIAIDDRHPAKTSILTFRSDKSKLRVYLLNMPSTDFALVREAKVLEMRSQGLNETFSLSQMKPLLKIMGDCVTNLRRVWNIHDAEGAEVGLSKRAEGNFRGLFSADDYPGVAVQNDQSGRVRFTMLIDEEGRVADCTVIETSGVPALDAQSCAIIKERAKFEPALDAGGKPVKDAAIQAVTWKLEP